MTEGTNQIAVWEQKITDLKNGVQKKANLLKWGAGLALLILFGPMVLTGLLVGAAALVVGFLIFCAVQLAPYFAQWLANKRTELQIAEANRFLQALKAEARRNPVETLQNVWIEQGRALKERADKIQKFSTKVIKYGQKLTDLKQQFPNETATFDKVYADMQLLLQKRQEAWKLAKAKHDQSEKEIEKAQAFWEMGLATQDLRESAGDIQAEFMQKIRKETALDAVQEQLAASMADLDQLLMEEIPLSVHEQKAISNNPSPVLNVQAVEVKEQVRR